MVRETDLVSYLPPFLREYREQKEALTAENPEFAIMWNAADRTLHNEFIATADEYGISRYENILGIHPFMEDTLESRRARVQSRWYISLPYTVRTLTEKLAALCGDRNFVVTKKLSVYQIIIDTELEMFGQIDELENVLNAVIPCNMITITRNTVKCTLVSGVYVGMGVVATEIISV